MAWEPGLEASLACSVEYSEPLVESDSLEAFHLSSKDCSGRYPLWHVISDNRVLPNSWPNQDIINR